MKFPDEVNNGVIEERTVPLSDSNPNPLALHSTDTLQYNNMIQ